MTESTKLHNETTDVSTSKWIIKHWDSHWNNTVSNADADRIEHIADLIGAAFGHDRLIYTPNNFHVVTKLNNDRQSAIIVRFPADVNDINNVKRYLDKHCDDYYVVLTDDGTCIQLSSKPRLNASRIGVDIDYDTHYLTFHVYK